MSQQQPLMFFCVIQKPDAKGYRPGAWIEATSKDEAIVKAMQEYDLDTPSQVALEFEMSKEDWLKDLGRPYQGD